MTLAARELASTVRAEAASIREGARLAERAAIACRAAGDLAHARWQERCTRELDRVANLLSRHAIALERRARADVV